MGLTISPRCDREMHDVRSLSLTYFDGHHVPAHKHGWAQLVFARSGMIRVLAASQMWLLPPTRALWIPAHVEHELIAKGEVAFRTLYVSARRSASVNRPLGVLQVSPLLRELILHILDIGMLDPEVQVHHRLASVLVDCINASPAVNLMLPLPTDRRALRLAAHFQSQPADNAELPVLAATTGASVRTLQRCFISETGMTVDSWRQTARLIASTALLAGGHSVTNAALDSGYDSPSAFIAAFKRQFSMTPGTFKRMG
jgi:AraC-like DNA-binding protein